MVVGSIVGEQHLANPGNPAGSLRHSTAVLAGDQNVDLRTGDLVGGGNRVESRGLERPVVVLGDDEGGHQITRASVLSLSTSSTTEPTLWPPCRFGGSSTLRTTRRGVTSTPRASGVVVTIGFFLARMMFGSEAYRGSLSRKSVVITAGNLIATVSSPPSTSRVTSACPSLIFSLEAKVACGQPSKADSIWPVWLQSSSIA